MILTPAWALIASATSRGVYGGCTVSKRWFSLSVITFSWLPSLVMTAITLREDSSSALSARPARTCQPQVVRSLLVQNGT